MILKLKECLDMDDKAIERIKATATFFPAIYEGKEGGTPCIPPFEKAAIEHINRRLKGEQYHLYPSLAQVILPSPGEGDYSGNTSGDLYHTGGKFLTTADFCRLMQGLSSLRVGLVDFWSEGKPILHPDFHKFTQEFMGSGINLGLLTCATWSDGQTTEVVVDGFSFLRVILDASNDQVYNRIHRPGHPYLFQQVIKNIERVIHERDRRKSQLVVGAETQLTQANMNFTEEITGLARDLGMDYIQLRIGSSRDSLLPEQVEMVKKLAEELKSVFHPFPVYAQIDTPRINSGCRLARFQLAVDATGEVHSCPCFRKKLSSRSFGNIFKQPIEKIWFNPRHRQVIESLERDSCKLIECRWHFCRDFLSFSRK
jgi:radical SAM protein with 4Fe4S-binding SPASM domain